MDTDIVPQRLPHKIFDLLLWLHETRPEIAEEERISSALIPKPDALQVLNNAWGRGALTEEEYQTIYDRLNKEHGEWCECKRGQTITIRADGKHICGACALGVTE